MTEETPKAQPTGKQAWMTTVLYPESQQVLIDFCKENLPCAWALHDKDVWTQGAFDSYLKRHNGELPEWKPGDLKKPHYHFLFGFKSARYFSGVAKEFTSVLGKEFPKAALERLHGTPYDAYIYLWHENAPDKFQYDVSVAEHNEMFNVPSQHAGMSQSDVDQVLALLEMPLFDTIEQMSRWAYENGCWASYRKNYSMWRDHWLERKRQKENEETRLVRDELQERLACLGNSQKVIDTDGFQIMPKQLEENF